MTEDEKSISVTGLRDSTVAETEALKSRLLAETARIGWAELETFFARGRVIYVAAELDLVEVASRFVRDDAELLQVWLQRALVARLSSEQARALKENQDSLWAVVVAPWVLVQQRQT